jgi:hypothetical protein
MCPTYYGIVPGREDLSAEINAPDKRHGRTVYLDYLARNGVISYTTSRGPTFYKAS